MAPVICLTGLSGSGKSTLAAEIERQLKERNIRVQILDGDSLRATLSRDLGYTPADRREHLRRVNFVAKLLAQHDITVVIAAIAPYRDSRAEMRSEHPDFIEVYVNASLETCERRDPKGLYRRARQGLIPAFTGVSDPYEAPLQPDVECKTDLETLEESAGKILSALKRISEIAAEGSRGG